MDQRLDTRPDPEGDPRPARLRHALAARAESRSGLRACRAERLARIRAGAAPATLPPEAASATLPPEAASATLPPEAAPRMPEPEAGMMLPPEAAGEEDESVLPARDVEALERFLAGLIGTIDLGPAPPQPARLAPARRAAVVPLARAAVPAQAAGDRHAAVAAGDRHAAVAAGDRHAAVAAGLARLPGAGPGLVGALIRGGVPDLGTLAGLGREALAERLGPLGRLIDLDAWLAFARAETGGGRPGAAALGAAAPDPVQGMAG